MSCPRFYFCTVHFTLKVVTHAPSYLSHPIAPNGKVSRRLLIGNQGHLSASYHTGPEIQVS